MRDARRGAGLAQETLPDFGIIGQLAAQRFHGERPTEPDLADTVDAARSAFADQRLDFVALVYDAAEQRIRGLIPIAGEHQGRAVERAKPRVGREALAAARAARRRGAR